MRRESSIRSIFWLAGEASGDMHAGLIMKKLNEEIPYLKHIGIGGPHMCSMGLKTIFPFEHFAVMGFVEVIKHLSFFLKVEAAIKKLFEEEKPDLVVLVDYPGLNLRIARIADDARIPVLYFICPQFWAWKHKRVFKLKDHTRHVACILPFEKELLDIHNITSTYVGHPIAEEIVIEKERQEFATFFGLDPTKQWIGFFPGSRRDEVEKLLPVYLQTIEIFKDTNFQFLISKARSIQHRVFSDYLEKHKGKNPFLIDGYNYEMMKYCEILVVKSGTTTLEAAFLGTPCIIVYKTNYISYLLGKHFIRVDKIGLPNLVLEKKLLPELIQNEVTAENISNCIKTFISNTKIYTNTKEELKKIKRILSEKSCSKETTKIIREMLKL